MHGITWYNEFWTQDLELRNKNNTILYDLHHYKLYPRSVFNKELLTYGIVTGKQIGRASCRERVSSPV